MTGVTVSVENLSVRVGAFALRNLNLSVAAGEILVLLGPNGAGKSVTLETIAGFHQPKSGRILVHGRNIARLPSEDRRVGLVFQNFGLFPHLSVARNVAIGLDARRAAPDAGAGGVPGDVPELLAHFGISHLADRDPRGLSAGEKQRVALARAFANRPDLFLFDEPFSALDARTRDQLREDLDHFVRASGVPAVFVTHDHSDARVLADRIAVIDDGAVIQEGSATEIFHRPINPFVANFVGIENVLPGRIEGRTGEYLRIAIGRSAVQARSAGDERDGQRVTVCIRAEDVSLHSAARPEAGAAPGLNELSARIVGLANLGTLTKVTVDCGFNLVAYVMTRQARELGLAPGAEMRAAIDAGSIHAVPYS